MHWHQGSLLLRLKTNLLFKLATAERRLGALSWKMPWATLHEGGAREGVHTRGKRPCKCLITATHKYSYRNRCAAQPTRRGKRTPRKLFRLTTRQPFRPRCALTLDESGAGLSASENSAHKNCFRIQSVPEELQNDVQTRSSTARRADLQKNLTTTACWCDHAETLWQTCRWKKGISRTKHLRIRTTAAYNERELYGRRPCIFTAFIRRQKVPIHAELVGLGEWEVSWASLLWAVKRDILTLKQGMRGPVIAAKHIVRGLTSCRLQKNK